MKYKYTEGPWAWFKGYLVTANEDGYIPINSKVICKAPPEFEEINPISKGREIFANAALIAAAPTMFDALQFAVEHFDKLIKPHPKKEKEVLKIMIQALEKATSQLLDERL